MRTALLVRGRGRPFLVRFTSSMEKPHAQTAFKRTNAAENRVADSLVFETRRYDERHEKAIREKTSPEQMLSISLLEEELRGEMAVVLGRMDARLREKMRVMEEANKRVYEVLARPTRDVPALLQVVSVFNDAQHEAYEARRDLIVQRQSAGFYLNNYDLILKRYPIPPKKRVRLG